MKQVPFRWDTRTRTRKGRTRICSVTITPYPNVAQIYLWIAMQSYIFSVNFQNICALFFVYSMFFSCFHTIWARCSSYVWGIDVIHGQICDIMSDVTDRAYCQQKTWHSSILLTIVKKKLLLHDFNIVLTQLRCQRH